MIDVSDEIRQGWLHYPPKKATGKQIRLLEDALGVPLPRQYVDFVTTFGFVNFGNDVQDTRIVTVRHDDGGDQLVASRATVGFLLSPERAMQTWTTFTDRSDPDAEDLPLIPDGFFPAANDNGQGLVLIELETGKIWFWRESAWRWGTEDNTRLGFVADDFDGFINGLRPEFP